MQNNSDNHFIEMILFLLVEKRRRLKINNAIQELADLLSGSDER